MARWRRGEVAAAAEGLCATPRAPKIASATTSSPLTFVEMATTVTATDAIEIVLPDATETVAF